MLLCAVNRVVYHERVQTTKVFLRDCTEVSPYALLLFGGAIDVRVAEGIIVLDSWARFRTVGRIAALIGSLRSKIDELLLIKISDPSVDIAAAKEAQALVALLQSDGMG